MTDDTEPSAEAGDFYRDEIIPWMMKYSITPQDQHERDIMLILDRFRAAGVREWQPIETAPRDGEWVLTCIAGTLIPFVAAFDDEPGDPCWFSFNRAYETGCKDQPYRPTHWMPLLKIPGASP